MAPRVQLRANRQAARSYREQSFDDDDDDDDSDENFVEPDDEEIEDEDPPLSPELAPQRRTPRSRPSTRGKAKVSYKEESDEVSLSAFRNVQVNFCAGKWHLG